MRFSVNVLTSGIGRLSSARCRSVGPASGVPSYNSPWVSKGAPFSRIRHLPVTSKLSSARPIGSTLLVAQIYHKLAQSACIMLAPAILMGAAFPLITQIYVSTRRRVGEGTGTLYAVNTAGAVVGSLGAGFVLIPAVGIQNSILLMA